jgi:NAD(P)H dehydrogenase (quinone)
MNILVVYAHPSENSFTYQVKESFIKGLAEAGHNVAVSDLYKMNFSETFTESEYLREAFYDEKKPVPEDVLSEQCKINSADAIAFIYPVFWTEAPAKLVGWFQRVWTYGFAYGDNPQMKTLEKAVFLVTMGGALEDKIRQEQAEAMKTVMLGDRISTRAKKTEFVVFDRMTRGYGNDETRFRRAEQFLKQAYQIGFEIQK